MMERDPAMTAHFRKANLIRRTNSPKVAKVLIAELKEKERKDAKEREALIDRRVTAITLAVIVAAGTIMHYLNKDAPRLVHSREYTPSATSK